MGLAKDNYPEYVPNARALFKPFGVALRFATLVNDGVSTLFAELEARHAATILTEGIIDVIPRTLVARPFSPQLPSTVVMIGLPALRPKPHAEEFARLLMEEARAC